MNNLSPFLVICLLLNLSSGNSSMLLSSTIFTQAKVVNKKVAVTPKQSSNTIKYQGKSWSKVGASGAASSTYEEFNDPELLTQWYDSFRSVSNNPDELLRVQLTTLDLIMGNTEGNTTFNNSIKKWQIGYNLIMHTDPGFSARPDGFGKVNTGIISVNCFKDRPKDTELKQVCQNVFNRAGTTLEKVIAMSESERRDFFYKNNLAIILGNQHLSSLRNQSAYIVDYLDNIGLGDISTTAKLVYIDQVNQLGLAGAKKLADIDRALLELSREELIGRFRSLGIVDTEYMFLTGYGARINFKKVPTNILRIAFARVQWHNTRGDMTNFESGHTWLNNYAREWTYDSLKKDYPNLEKEIKAAIVNEYGAQDWKTYRFTATGSPDETIKVEVFNANNDVAFTKNYKPKNAHYYTDQKVATSDIMRRIAQVPQSQVTYNAMKADTSRFLSNVFYPNFNLKRP